MNCWLWLSSPTVTIAIHVVDGRVVEAPPIYWWAVRKGRTLTFDRVEYLPDVQGEL